METLTEQEYLTSGHQSPAKTSSDSKAATSSAADTATEEVDPFFGMLQYCKFQHLSSRVNCFKLLNFMY